jgi:hypothetical protein
VLEEKKQLNNLVTKIPGNIFLITPQVSWNTNLKNRFSTVLERRFTINRSGTGTIPVIVLIL